MSNERELRFGTVALEKSFITKDQLVDALITQIDDNIDRKKHRLIGTILFDLGYITHQQIDQILSEIG